MAPVTTGRRILFLTPYFFPETGAAPVRVTATADALAAQGWEVRVCTGMPNYPEGVVHPEYRRSILRRETRASGVRVTRLRTVAGGGQGLRRYLNFASSAATCLVPALGRWRPDVVVAEIPPPTQFLAAWIVARRFRAVLVSSVADLWPETAIRLGLLSDTSIVVRMARSLEAVVYRRSDKLVAITEGIAEHLVVVRGRSERDVTAIRNGIDTELFFPGEPDPVIVEAFHAGPNPYLLYAGSLGVATDPTVLVRLANELAADRIDVLVVGAGTESSVIETAQADHPNLQYRSSVPQSTVAALYRGSLAGLVTLADNPFFSGTVPAKLLPILGSGVPVLFAGAGEGADLIKRTGSGEVVASGDAAGLAAHARVLASNAHERDRLGAAGRALAVDQMSWVGVGRQWARFLET